MTLQTLDEIKAAALSALGAGQLEEADGLYAQLAVEYDRHGFATGLLAVHFNHLLVALERGDRPRIESLMDALVQGVSEPVEDRLQIEIAQRICRLFVDEVAGVPHEKTALLVTVAAEAAQMTLPSGGRLPDELPDADQIARLRPLDAAWVVLDLASACWGRTEAPAWVRSIHQNFGPPAGLSLEVATLMERFAAEALVEDTLHAVQTLTSALSVAARHSARLAAELSVGLADLLELGVPDRLQYAPALPLEARLLTVAELHGRLGAALEKHAGSERLALGQWAAAEALGRAWLEARDTRAARGGGRAEDPQNTASVTLWVARALRARGAFDAALTCLEGPISLARRGAFDDAHTAGEILLAASDLLERRGSSLEAAGRAHDALAAVMPALRVDPGLAALARAIDVTTGHSPHRVTIALRALAAIARLEKDPAVWTRAADLLALSRVHLCPEQIDSIGVVLGLSGVRLGLPGAARLAFEAGTSAGDPSAVSIALLHLGQAQLKAAGADAEAVLAALDRLVETASVARQAPAGAVRRWIEIAVADAHLRHAPDSPRIEIHLRRAAELVEGGRFVRGALPLDVFEGAAQIHTLDAVARRLIRAGRGPLARRLAGAARVGSTSVWTPQQQPVSSPISTALAAAHRSAFTQRWVHDERVDGQIEAARGMLLDERPRGVWRGRPLAPNEARIEFRIADDWMGAFVTRADETRVFEWQLAGLRLEEKIEALRAVLESGAPEVEVRLQASALYDILIGPVAATLEGITRLLIAPDGPLKRLPFATLWDECWLAERVDLAVLLPAAAPTFMDTAPLAPPSALIVGDMATTRDLRLATLTGDDLFGSVSARHGSDLESSALATALGGARVLHFVGSATTAGLQLAEAGRPTGWGELAHVIGDGGALCASVMGPVDTPAVFEALAGLLPGVRGGLVARVWSPEEDGTFLLRFLSGIARAQTPEALVVAMGETRRVAIEAGLSVHQWAAYELVMPEIR